MPPLESANTCPWAPIPSARPADFNPRDVIGQPHSLDAIDMNLSGEFFRGRRGAHDYRAAFWLWCRSPWFNLSRDVFVGYKWPRDIMDLRRVEGLDSRKDPERWFVPLPPCMLDRGSVPPPIACPADRDAMNQLIQEDRDRAFPKDCSWHYRPVMMSRRWSVDEIMSSPLKPVISRMRLLDIPFFAGLKHDSRVWVLILWPGYEACYFDVRIYSGTTESSFYVNIARHCLAWVQAHEDAARSEPAFPTFEVWGLDLYQKLYICKGDVFVEGLYRSVDYSDCFVVQFSIQRNEDRNSIKYGEFAYWQTPK